MPLLDFEKSLATLPVVTRHAGETVLTPGSKTGQLLILKRGAVAVLKDSVEIARLDQPGLVFGELSALLDRPHTAEVRALEDSQFHVAEAVLLEKDHGMLLYVARIMAERILAADSSLALLLRLHQAGHPLSLDDVVHELQEVILAGRGGF